MILVCNFSPLNLLDYLLALLGRIWFGFYDQRDYSNFIIFITLLVVKTIDAERFLCLGWCFCIEQRCLLFKRTGSIKKCENVFGSKIVFLLRHGLY